MKKILRLTVISLVTLTLISGAMACKSSSTTTTSSTTASGDESVVRAYADKATEITLQGLSEDNLSKYTQYGNAAFKAALTQQVLDTTSTQINSQLGSYKSITFLSYEEQQGYIIVHYKAQYSKGETGVKMVFDADHLVAGQWFE